MSVWCVYVCVSCVDGIYLWYVYMWWVGDVCVRTCVWYLVFVCVHVLVYVCLRLVESRYVALEDLELSMVQTRLALHAGCRVLPASAS